MKASKVLVITFCHDSNGAPTAVAMFCQATAKRVREGEHYERVFAALQIRGYEAPMVHFDEMEAPKWMIDDWKGGLIDGAKYKNWKPLPRAFLKEARERKSN